MNKAIFKPMVIEKEYYSDNSRISNSATNWFEDSPLTYKERLFEGKEEESINAYRKGSMEHMWLLQKEEFWKNYEILDFEIPQSKQQKDFAEKCLKISPMEAFKEVYSTKGKSEDKIASESLEMAEKLKPYIGYLKKSTEKEIISFAELQSLKKTEENIQNHKLANKLLLDFTGSREVYAMSEFHINWEYPAGENNLPCKSLLDRFIIDVENKTLYLIDIKTTKSVYEFGESFKKFSYAKQLKWYWMAIVYYLSNYSNLDFEEFEKKTYIVVIKNHGNKQIKVISLSEDTLQPESWRIYNIMKELAWHYENKKWDYTREYYEGDGSETLKMAA